MRCVARVSSQAVIDKRSSRSHDPHCQREAGEDRYCYQHKRRSLGARVYCHRRRRFSGTFRFGGDFYCRGCGKPLPWMVTGPK